jgi:hypothetical protein
VPFNDLGSKKVAVCSDRVRGHISIRVCSVGPILGQRLFALVTDLEITMTSAIRREFVDNTGWTKRLPQERYSKIEKEIFDAKARDAFVDSILFTQVADKVTIIKKSEAFGWI